MSTATRFDRFLAKVTPKVPELGDAIQRAMSVSRSLHSYFYPNADFDSSKMTMIGSFGKSTTVLPVRDIDIVFDIPGSVWLRFHQHSGNGQSALLQEVRAQLLKTYPRSDIRGDGPVVKALFASGHSVEVVPAHKYNGEHFVALSDDGGHWGLCGYETEIASLSASDKNSNGQTRRLVRMLKVWQDECNVPISSLALELGAKHFLETWHYKGKSSTWDDLMVRDYFEALVSKANSWSAIPGSSDTCYYGNRWVTKAETALDNARDACKWEAAGDHTTACFVWRKIFGEKFGY